MPLLWGIKWAVDEIFAEMKMNDEEKNVAAFRLSDGGFAGDS